MDEHSDYDTLFQHYAESILPFQGESLAKLKQWLHSHQRVAITCFEADPLMCHRHKIAELLSGDPDIKLPISHL